MSEHWVRKMNTYFTRIDFDKDGSITKKDFDGMAERFIQYGKFDKARSTDINATLAAVWDKYLSKVGGGTSINRSDFIASMKKMLKDDNLKKIIQGPLPHFFHAVDLNNDGLISKEEYENFFDIIGTDKAIAAKAFDVIDENKDGQLSLEEFLHAGSEFFLCQEETPKSLFWGTLV